jgi:hypothetical protein
MMSLRSPLSLRERVRVRAVGFGVGSPPARVFPQALTLTWEGRPAFTLSKLNSFSNSLL